VGVMHRHVRRNRFHADLRQFTEAVLRFPGGTLPREWEAIAEPVTRSFRLITHDGYRMAACAAAAMRRRANQAGKYGPVQFSEYNSLFFTLTCTRGSRKNLDQKALQCAPIKPSCRRTFPRSFFRAVPVAGSGRTAAFRTNPVPRPGTRMRWNDARCQGKSTETGVGHSWSCRLGNGIQPMTCYVSWIMTSLKHQRRSANGTGRAKRGNHLSAPGHA